MNGPDLPLQLSDVCKTIAGRAVLAGVDLACAPGSVTALLGPNGAGKTTMVNIAAGLRRPDSGTARLFGLPPAGAAARTRFSLVPQDISFPGPVTVRQCVDLVEGQRPPSDLVPDRIELCDELGLSSVLNRSVGALSGGQRRRLAVVLGLVRAPGLLLLDEATSNLDEAGRAIVWRLVSDYSRRGGAVLVTTHILSDLESVADRVIGMSSGRVVREGSLAEIRDSLGGRTVEVRVPAVKAVAITSAAARSGVGLSVSTDTSYPSHTTLRWRTADPLRLLAHIASSDPTITDVNVVATPLSELLSELEK
ncbi:ABC transporter ATP-binding protein [Jatrophihabitans telluris]|uniref:ABC transporter ATP-binding protein n=1 Tax=Jatrophihabitans telluris TaxID=2038343 RepID=A0ABY4QYN8_9ACTN|nr:ABC transporter ATP-binding protein [Jatrophihabitans telluris]UQX87984.1 ABC transporter ATP-binding protein [Jatrophihabitans telluris]